MTSRAWLELERQFQFGCRPSHEGSSWFQTWLAVTDHPLFRRTLVRAAQAALRDWEEADNSRASSSSLAPSKSREPRNERSRRRRRCELREEVVLRIGRWFRDGLPADVSFPTEPRQFPPWLRQILRDECRQALGQLPPDRDFPRLALFPAVDDQRVLCQIWSELNRLSGIERTVLLLWANGHSLDQIAHQLRIPRVLTDHLLRRGLRHLRS
jgi:hypothetical protein